jgi:mono/diheme cytochrome c family protein
MMLRLFAVSLGLVAGSFGAANSTAPPTYTRDVAAILNKRCVECHRKGEVAPMALTSYKEVRPWAKAIQEAAASRRMPPWLADPHVGAFANDRRLTDRELDTIRQWVAAGAPEGAAKDLPPSPEFVEGWTIGKPDAIVDIGTDFPVPATGVVKYQYITVDTGFDEDKWIEAAEIRPDKRSVVHHIIVFMTDPGLDRALAVEGGNLLVGYAPGDPPMNFAPGTAKLLPKGSKLRFQLHYTPNGTATTDRSYVGFRFARNPPRHRAVTGRALNFGFVIPPGAPAHEVKASWTAKTEVRLTGLMPHMHLRGKDFEYTVVYPDGRTEKILSVPKYDFNWQLAYELKEPLALPKGTRIDCVAHFDNSPNNKYNPDPSKEVRWGDQTWEEMMIGWFTYTIPNEPVEVTRAGNE